MVYSGSSRVSGALERNLEVAMKGRCLCGSIEVVAADRHEVGLCHCTMCRRWTGGPMFAIHGGKDVQFSGDTPAAYRSSEWAERGFCPRCGTHLFYRLVQNGEYALPVGLFQDVPFTLVEEIFIDEKPAFYDFANQTRKKTGQQVFEEVAPKP